MDTRRRLDRRSCEPPSELAVPRQEQMLIGLLNEIPGQRILCVSLGRAQLAQAAATSHPNSHVTCWFLDLYRLHLAELYQTASESASGTLAGSDPAVASPSPSVTDLPAAFEVTSRLHVASSHLELVCSADFPEQTYDAVLLPFSVSGEAELTRDLMQAAYLRLREGGTLAVAVDNPNDHWLRKEMEKLFPRVIRDAGPQAVTYRGIRAGPLKKEKNFGCEFACRDGERLLRVFSRPGVFAHRRVDPGARHLLNFMELHIGDRVLDLGCGSGVVTLGVAASSAQIRVHAVDTNARAVECTRQAAMANQLDNVTVELNLADTFQSDEPFQLVLANPPYFSGTRISRAFLDAARRCLEPGGRILLVTKLPDWYAEHLCEWFDNVRCEEVKKYFLFQGTQPT